METLILNKTTETKRPQREPVFNNPSLLVSTWYVACRSRDLRHGSLRSIELGPKRLVVYRDESGQIHAMCGIGDWITGVVKKDGAPVDSVVPKQGGIQWTESYSIGKGSQKQDLVKKFIKYMTSGPGQVRSSQMAAYPAMSPYKSGWTALNQANPAEAKRQRMNLDGPNCIDDLREGRIHFRRTPIQQSLEDWNDFWSEYKNA